MKVDRTQFENNVSFDISNLPKFEPITSSTGKSLKLYTSLSFLSVQSHWNWILHLSALKRILRGGSLAPTMLVASAIDARNTAIEKRSFMDQIAVHMKVQATYSRARQQNRLRNSPRLSVDDIWNRRFFRQSHVRSWGDLGWTRIYL